LTSKDLLKRNLQRYTDMGGRGGESFEIMPLTFLLPHEHNQFVNAFVETDKPESNIWIMKPIGLSRGRGIHLVRDLTDLTFSQVGYSQHLL
jgi:tubulin polyglutamylase TTLL5